MIVPILYKRRSDMPPGPIPLPVVGNLFQVGTKPHISLLNLSHIYGGAMTLFLGKVQSVVITDPEYIKEVFVNQSDYTTDRFLSNTTQIIGNNIDLLFSNGDYWKRLRFILASCFIKMKSHLSIIEKIQTETFRLTDAFQPFVETGEPVSPRKFFKIFTLNIIMKLLFDEIVGYNEKEENDVIEAVTWVEHELAVGNIPDLLPFLSVFFNSSREKLKKSLEKVWVYSKAAITRHRQALAKNPNRCDDLMDMILIEIAKSEDPDFFTDEGISRISTDLLLSGTETSSSTLEWLFLFLMNYPHYMLKIKEELSKVCAPSERIKLTHRQSTPFLVACIKEVLRIRPVGALSLPRYASRDLTVGPYTIPKGTQLLMNVYGLAMSPKFWEDPEEFRPERWMNENNVSTGNDYKNLAFGIGSRSCIGSNLAKDEMYLAAANLLHQYNFKPANVDPKTDRLPEDGHFGIALSCTEYKFYVSNADSPNSTITQHA
ncbi:cytochrome P450 family protein [Heterostelium album PN500]|uniref:Cytochrome P450 family protein n=1 Tax=Heterostelium pallidum (strain ATCC 26659 / Pp 5 / PN500) TaxID=670386 RepID=D3B1N0_HETP5|nr:cytochrome P450 family protein [Heterostelium album PN500]EFA85204.1 cytochrome P450 family protein [Heterostelium album PN500]|eukprot:XP_020437313.1 cytochrome P450 family protein [Heterostelium album PN500]